MRTIHDYDSFTDALLEKAYQQGLRDGREAKPLRWRTGPVPHRGVKYLTAGWIQVKAGWAVYETDYWLPLSEILDLIGG